MLPGARFGQRRGGSGGRMRGGSRATATGRGCAKLVRTTTRLYIGVGQVREWLGEVGARTELLVKVMLDSRLLNGVHQADLLYNKGAHYYWITSRTLKRTAMGKWFLGWSHTPTDGLVLLLRSPSKDEIAAAIAEGFQGKDEDEDTEASEQQAQLQQLQQQQMLHAQSPQSPHPIGRMQSARSLTALTYGDEDAMMLMQQQPLPTEMDDLTEGGQYHRATPLSGPARLGPAGDEDDAVSGLSGDSELRRALGPSDPRLMVALAAAELQQRSMYPGGGTPSAANLGRRQTAGLSGGVGAGAGRGYAGGRDMRDLQQPLPGGRPQPGMGPAGGGPQPPYREAPARTGSEGLNAAGGGATTPNGQPRNLGPPPARFTNFSEVPGGTAFANVPSPTEHLGLDPQPPLPQQRGGGGAAAMPSQLGAMTSIASNISLAGATQLTGAASMLQASGVAGPIAAPLRLPTNVSELLPPEYLPAAVSVRCTLDGSLQPEIFACEIHRNRQGHCYLYNLPPTVLEGRSQQDWMISEDGCLVLCLKTVQQPSALVENKSVRSNPSNPQGGAQLGVGNANADNPAARGGSLPARGPTSAEKPSTARSQRKSSDVDMGAVTVKQQAPAFLGGTGMDLSPRPLDHHHEQLQQSQAAEEDAAAAATAAAAAAAETGYVVAAVPERKQPDGRRERPPQLSVPRQAIESLYGNVLLPHPVLLRYQIDGEPEQQVYLAEVLDAGAGELYLRGASMDPLVGRTLTGWRRGSVLSHQLLVVCLETRPDSAGQGKAGAVAVGTRGGRGDEEPRRARNDQAPSPQQLLAGQPSPHQQPASANWGAPGDAQRGPANTAAANPFGQQQPCLSEVTAAQLPSRPSTQQPLGAAAAGGAPRRQQQQQQQPQQLQPVMSGPLPGVGSSMLPPSLSLINNGSSNLLPAQASNLPFTASAPRPEANASVAAGGAAGSRPASAGARGGTAAGAAAASGAPGQRSPSLNPDAGAGMLQTVASATQAPLQAPGSKSAAGGRAPPAAPMYPWEGAAAGQAAPTVFAFGLGMGQEPSSPKGGAEPSASGKRPSQPQGHGQGRGGGAAGSTLHSAAAESALMPRNTVQTADFSSANAGAGSHVRGGGGGGAHQHCPPSQQHSLQHQGNSRRMDEADAEHGELLRRSPSRRGSGGAAANGGGGSGDLDAAPGRRPPESECLAALSAPVNGGVQGELGPTTRYLASHTALAAEPAGPNPQDATQQQQVRPRGGAAPDHRSQAQSQSWRFDVQHAAEAQRLEQQGPGASRPAGVSAVASTGVGEMDLPESQPSLASLPAGGLVGAREGSRWGDAQAQGPSSIGGDDSRRHAFPCHHPEGPYVPGSAPGRAGTGTDIDLPRGGGGDPEGQRGAAAPSSRAAAEAAEPRSCLGGAHGEVGGTGWADAQLRRAFAAAEAPQEQGDVEMEDAGPGAGWQKGRTEPPLPQAGRAHAGLSGAVETGNCSDAQPGAQAMDVEVDGQATAQTHNQHPSQPTMGRRPWDGGHGTSLEAPREAYNQAAAPGEPSRQGSGAAAAFDHQQPQQQQQSMWFPRLDLTAGVSAFAGPQQGGEATEASESLKASEGSRSGHDNGGQSGEEGRPLPRRGVLRMLSVVVHEPEEGGETQQQRLHS